MKQADGTESPFAWFPRERQDGSATSHRHLRKKGRVQSDLDDCSVSILDDRQSQGPPPCRLPGDEVSTSMFLLASYGQDHFALTAYVSLHPSFYSSGSLNSIQLHKAKASTEPT